MINLYHSYKPIGKVVYYINGERFTNTSSQEKDGKKKALIYCAKNHLTEDCIIKFDSELECDRYEYLLNLEMKGFIKELSHHKVVCLIPEFVNANGDLIHEVSYNCDFIYFDNIKNRLVYEDVKGASLLLDTRFEVLKSIFDYSNRHNNRYIKIVIRRDGNWAEWKMGDNKKPMTAKKKRQLKEQALKKQLQEQEKEKKKIERIKELYLKYKSLSKLTKKQKEKLVEYENYLKEKGVLL